MNGLFGRFSTPLILLMNNDSIGHRTSLLIGYTILTSFCMLFCVPALYKFFYRVEYRAKRDESCLDCGFVLGFGFLCQDC